MSVYREEFLLRSKDVDMFRRLRTSELFRLLQEASIRHTEQLGGILIIDEALPRTATGKIKRWELQQKVSEKA